MIWFIVLFCIELNAALLLLAIIFFVLVLTSAYWLYRVIKYIEHFYLTCEEVFSVSKDGFETVVSRKQSKRNFAMFMRLFMKGEPSKFKTDEEFWWYTKIIKSQYDLDDRYQKFIENFKLNDHNEEFAYEGIFDKKEKEKMQNSRLEASYMYIPLNRSKVIEDNNIKLNSSNLMMIKDDVSNTGASPISDASNNIRTGARK